MKRNEHRRGWGGQLAKRCCGCRKYRLLKFFYANAARWDKKSHRCKLCESKRSKDDAVARPELKKQYSRMWRASNPQALRTYALRTVYGITSEQYDAMLSSQNNVCAICYRPETKKLRGKIVSLAVDHCHTTGKVRGLLCQSCNQGIGALKDDLAVLKQAITYLEIARQ